VRAARPGSTTPVASGCSRIAGPITTEPARPETIYVPAYNPTVVYGAWPYPAYPPYYYPGVAAWYPGAGLAYGLAWGVGIAAAGAIFGSWNWGRGDVDINVNRATNISNSFNRNSVAAGGKWQHNAQHRGNVGYRDQGSRDRYSGGRASGADSRRDFRGRDGDRGGIGTGVRFGQAEAAKLLTPGQWLEPFFLLGIGAIFHRDATGQ